MAITMHVCGLCGHEEADTLITRLRWQAIEAGDGELREACARCREEHPDWADRLAALEGPSS